MAEELQDYERAPSRAVFITVLCILTFIGSGWSVINNSYKYFTANMRSAEISVAREKANADMQEIRTPVKVRNLRSGW
ncbi:MAG: hypothetical protein JWP81_4533 [Ferruginibacter sp.]|nr:hypothetical protein [Ferruginibacter sp.]